jgi:DnaJ like chaperone protein
MLRLLLVSFLSAICVFIAYRILSDVFQRALSAGRRPRFDGSGRDHSRPRPDGKQDSWEREKRCRNILGVSQDAGEEAIKAAYRAQLAKYHPDKVTHLGGEFYDLASSRTKDIINAYEFLKNKYDFQ